jgi:hypothetical protein
MISSNVEDREGHNGKNITIRDFFHLLKLLVETHFDLCDGDLTIIQAGLLFDRDGPAHLVRECGP